MTHTSDAHAPAGADRAREDLAGMDDTELLEVSTERAEALCTGTVPLGQLFPTLAARHYLTMPTLILPARIHVPFRNKSWAHLMGMSPQDLLEMRRMETATVGELLVKLRAETAVLEGQGS